MLFKINLILLFAFLSFNIQASTWPYDKESLLEEMNITYAALNAKVEFCRELRNRQIIEIKSDWLYSLSEKKRKSVLSIVSNIAQERCTKKEKVNYTMALMNYTSETGDEVFLESWIILNKMHYTQEKFDDLKGVSAEKIIELSNLPELYFPFAWGADKLVVPEKK